MNSMIVRDAMAKFLSSRGRNYEFPAGGLTEILTSSESALEVILSHAELNSADLIKVIWNGGEWTDYYPIVIFSVRLAIVAVREGRVDLFHKGVVVLLAAIPKIDWRDALGAMSVFNDCGHRLKVSFEAEASPLLGCIEVAETIALVKGFIQRSDKMKSVEAMGIEASGSNENLVYRAKSY